MAYELKDGQGSMGSNSYKTKENQPDVTGKFLHDGHMHKLSAWKKVAQDGRIWYSVNIQDVAAESESAPTTTPPTDIPF